MKDLSIILPCYNESKNLFKLLPQLKNILKKNFHLKIEFVIVNNGSIDETENILKEIFNIKNFKIVTIKKNIGYGNGIKKGIFKASGKIIAWTHADMQTSPDDVVRLYKKYRIELLNNNCVVKGLRKNRPFFDSLFSYFMGIMSSCIFSKRLIDVNAQPKIFNREFLNLLRNAPKDFSLDLFFLYTAIKNNFKIYTLPVYFNKRLEGSSKGGGSFYGKIKLTFRTLAYIINLKIHENNFTSNK
jgi:glycosyltransferase involved in cell wall biosynthesis